MVATIETARLRLRHFTADDTPAIYAYACDPEIARLGMWPPSASLEETRDEICAIVEGYQGSTQWTWVIERKDDQSVIGRCDLLRYRREHQSVEISYALARHAWGQGYATEAMRALAGFAFDELGLHRLEAIVLAFNAASIRVLEKIGMQREGVKREAYFLDGNFVDLYCYGLLTPS